MSTTGIFELTAVTTGSLQSDDVLVVVDVHDTAQAAQGSTRKTTLANLYQTNTTAVTVSTPLPNIAQSWNNAAIAFTGVLLNVTNTASAAASLLLDLQVGGTSQFKVGKAGVVTTTGALAITGALTGATTGAFSGAVGTGALTVTGAATVSTTLGVTGAATFSSTVATGALTVTGAASISTTLLVSGASTFNGTVTAGGGTIIDAPTGFMGVSTAGLSATTSLNLPAGTTSASSLRVAHGAAPTSPVNGDMWSTTSGMFCRINGVTKTFTLT